MELRRYLEELIRGTGVDPRTLSTDQIISTGRPLIFDFSYPSYGGEDEKAQLETKILRHYYMEELGAETPALWKLYLEDRLNLIMPEYVARFNAVMKITDPLVEISVRYGGEDKYVASSTSAVTGQDWRADSDVAVGENYKDIQYVREAQSIEKNDQNATNGNSTTTYGKTETGRRRSEAQLLKEYQELWENFDLQVVNSLFDLFMLI